MNKDKIKNIIHDTIYSRPSYPHIGNDNILAANWILATLGINDIDMICKLAKIIDKHSTYDHEISKKDFNKIIELLSDLIDEYLNEDLDVKL